MASVFLCWAAAHRLLRLSPRGRAQKSAPPDPEIFLLEAKPRQRRFQRFFGLALQRRSPGHPRGTAMTVSLGD